MPIEVLYLLLGWLLGLMSPLITERIRNVLLRRRVGKAFKTELTTLRYRLMCAVQQMAEQNGRYNRSVLQWCRDTLEECGTGEIADRLRSHWDDVLKLSDKQIEQLGQVGVPGEDTSKNLSPLRLPFLDSHLDKIEIFSLDTRQALLDIRSQLEFLNDHIGQTRMFLEMTFTVGLEDSNRSKIIQNVNGLSEHIEKRARAIADMVGALKAI